jgi:hypothetical protein
MRAARIGLHGARIVIMKGKVMRAHKMVIAVATGGFWVAQRPAAADVFSCSQHFDSTRVWDRE